MDITIRKMLLVMLPIFVVNANAQDSSVDSVSIDTAMYAHTDDISEIQPIQKANLSDFIIPTVLISYGAISMGIGGLDELIHDKWETKPWRTKVDDVLLYTPIVSVYALDLFGVKAKNDFKDRVIVTTSSYLLNIGSTQFLKFATHRRRPDGTTSNSFPSGHTSNAFVGAHILMKEYRHISPWIGISGYAVASFTGFLRIAKDRHWFSDVVAGAGFGILSVEVGYLLLPYLSDMLTFNKKDKILSVSPIADNYQMGLSIQYTF